MRGAEAVMIPSSDGIDMRRPGTAVQRWSNALSDQPYWLPPRGPLVVVAPHPDEECLGAGGLMYTWARSGQPVAVVSVTDGEAARPRWRGLSDLRQRELKHALRELGGGSILLVRLGLPDGQIDGHLLTLRHVLRQLGTGGTLIGPFERDGHPDQEQVGRLCCELGAENQMRVARYPIWAWHQLTPATLRHCRWGRFVLSEAARQAKARAVRCFQSQLQARVGAAVLPQHLLRYFEGPEEAFIL
jgi:LmbE family N-acetylglucosaminyl deacetylase